MMCLCNTLACGYMSTSVPNLQRILVCYSSQLLAWLPTSAENPAFIALLVPVSTLVFAKMASAMFVQSRTKLALKTARNVTAIKIRRKAESECPAWEV